MTAWTPPGNADDLRWVERAMAVDPSAWYGPGGCGAARRVLASGRPGLALELPDLYPDTVTAARAALDSAARALRSDEPERLVATDPPPVVAALLMRWQRALPRDQSIARWDRFASLPFRGRPLRVRWSDRLLELGRTPVLHRGNTENLRRYAGAANAELRFAQLLVDAQSCRLAVRLPLSGLGDEELCAAAAAACAAISAAEQVLPPTQFLVLPEFDVLLALAGRRSPGTSSTIEGATPGRPGATWPPEPTLEETKA